MSKTATKDARDVLARRVRRMELLAAPGSPAYICARGCICGRCQEAAEVCSICDRPIGYCCFYRAYPHGEYQHVMCVERVLADQTERDAALLRNPFLRDEAVRQEGTTHEHFATFPIYVRLRLLREAEEKRAHA